MTCVSDVIITCMPTSYATTELMKSIASNLVNNLQMDNGETRVGFDLQYSEPWNSMSNYLNTYTTTVDMQNHISSLYYAGQITTN